MKTTELIRTPDVSDEAQPESISSEPPTNADMAGEILPLVESVPVAGPSVILLAGPVVLFALALTGERDGHHEHERGALVALTCAILASPYLLVRRLRTCRSFRAPASAPTAQFIPAGSRQRAV